MDEREAAIAEKEAKFKDWEAALARKETALKAWGDELQAQDEALEKREAALKEAELKGGNPAPPFDPGDLKLLAEVCAAHRITDADLLSWMVSAGVITLVTAGGSKVRYAPGDAKAEGFKPLRRVAVTGRKPEK